MILMNVAFLCKQITCIAINEVRVFEVVTHGFPHAEHMQWDRGNECGSVGRGRKMSGRERMEEEEGVV